MSYSKTKFGNYDHKHPLILGYSGFTQPLAEMSTRSIKIMFLGSNAAAGA
jgi:hypothetical protein